jgi:hypothetical protein
VRTLPILLIISPLLAHDGYSDWTNQLRESCCEDRHCRPLDDSEVRTDSQNTYVKIADEWCEVKSSDYARGTSPDWSHTVAQFDGHLLAVVVDVDRGRSGEIELLQ